jgi:hypothetical protein
MTLINLMKRGSAILLLISFFLPLSQCTKFDAHESSTAIYESYSAYSSYEWPSIGSSIALFLFSWPVIFQIIAFSRHTLVSPRITVILELFFSILTVCGISWLIYFGSRVQYGAFVAYGATIAYFGTTLWVLLASRPKAFKRDALKRAP